MALVNMRQPMQTRALVVQIQEAFKQVKTSLGVFRLSAVEKHLPWQKRSKLEPGNWRDYISRGICSCPQGCEQTNNADSGMRVVLSVPEVNGGEVTDDKRRPAVATGVLAIGAVSVIRDHVPEWRGDGRGRERVAEKRDWLWTWNDWGNRKRSPRWVGGGGHWHLIPIFGLLFSASLLEQASL